MFGAGLLTPPKGPTEGLPVNRRPSVDGLGFLIDWGVSRW